MTNAHHDFAAIVVNHDAGDALLDCVHSLRRSGIQQIVVVDNASSDGSLERLGEADRDVVLLPTGKNLGYGSAVNIGAKRIDAPYILVCNPDLIIESNVPAVLQEVFDAHDDVAIVGPRILSPDGEPYPSARSFPQLAAAIGHAFVGLYRAANPWSDEYLARSREDVARVVDWVSGACFGVRSIAFSSLGGFDERYFMYVEDLDLCWRLRRSGWLTRYTPQAVVTHERGGSSKQHPYRLLVAHHRSTWRFVRKSSAGTRRALLPVIALGIAARLVLAIAKVWSSEHGSARNQQHRTVG